MSMYVIQSNEDGTYTEKKVYSDEDMKAFGKWLLIEIEWWERESDEINYYVKKWEEQKNG